MGTWGQLQQRERGATSARRGPSCPAAAAPGVLPPPSRPPHSSRPAPRPRAPRPAPPGFVRPVADASQDAQLLSAARAPNGTVTFSLRRALRPCDAKRGADVAIRPGGALYVIWAAGPWPLGYHGPSRGSQLLVLAPPSASEAALARAAAVAAGKAPASLPADAAAPAAARAAPSKAPPATGQLPAKSASAGPGAAGGGALALGASPLPVRDAQRARRRLRQAGAVPGHDAAVAAAAAAEAAAAKDGRTVVNITLPPLKVPAKTTSYLVRYVQLPSDRWGHWAGVGQGGNGACGVATGVCLARRTPVQIPRRTLLLPPPSPSPSTSNHPGGSCATARSSTRRWCTTPSCTSAARTPTLRLRRSQGAARTPVRGLGR
jgi:hypothetical protein